MRASLLRAVRAQYSGVLANSLERPARTYPIVVCVAVVVVTLTYLLPLMITFGTYPNYEHVRLCPLLANSSTTR